MNSRTEPSYLHIPPFKHDIFLGAVLLTAFLFCAWQDHAATGSKSEFSEWKTHGGTSKSLRYSSLDQIDRKNVRQLELAWSFETGDSLPGSEMQCNPIVVDGVLYVSTPKMNVIALDAATGQRVGASIPMVASPPARRRATGVSPGGGKETINASLSWFGTISWRSGRATER